MEDVPRLGRVRQERRPDLRRLLDDGPLDGGGRQVAGLVDGVELDPLPLEAWRRVSSSVRLFASGGRWRFASRRILVASGAGSSRPRAGSPPSSRARRSLHWPMPGCSAA
jgi:hypothetical protein